jgi:DNA-binding NtrC family response regulator
MKKSAVLIAGGDEALHRHLKATLLQHGYEVVESPDSTEALRCVQSKSLNLMVIGFEQDGVDQQPFSHEALATTINRCLSDSLPQKSLAAGDTTASRGNNGRRMIGESPLMRKINVYISKVASTDSTVLITGESGTGKELVAELIHRNSPRQQKPFLRINCAAIPDSLLESELFGYERGAFTGAHAFKEGQLKLADRGTVFLDEIGDMSPYAQAKVLRAIENREVQRLGGKGSTPLDIRLLAATNQDLEQLIAEGKFRKDLYFRLSVARIQLPSLRDRKEDIPLLFDHYIAELNRRFGLKVEGFTEEALAYLLDYDWPGNVRELKNLLEATFVNLPSRRIGIMDLPEPFRERSRQADGPLPDERERVLSALVSTQWSRRKAAEQLHWSRMTLYRKMLKYDLIRGGNTEGCMSTASEGQL